MAHSTHLRMFVHSAPPGTSESGAPIGMVAADTDGSWYYEVFVQGRIPTRFVRMEDALGACLGHLKAHGHDV